MDRASVARIMEAVKGNRERLENCPRHLFGGDYKIGQRKSCERCGGEMRLTEIGDYIRGYVAHGGEANDIWPGWNEPRQKQQS